MRPQSEERITLSAVLLDGGGTSRELAARGLMSKAAATRVLDNMVRAGDAAKTRMVRVPGVRRPVPWYERAIRQADMASANEPMQSLLQAWAAGRAA